MLISSSSFVQVSNCVFWTSVRAIFASFAAWSIFSCASRISSFLLFKSLECISLFSSSEFVPRHHWVLIDILAPRCDLWTAQRDIIEIGTTTLGLFATKRPNLLSFGCSTLTLLWSAGVIAKRDHKLISV